MRVKTLSQTFDSDDEPIMLILSKQEKSLIANMGKQTQFGVFPAHFDIVDKVNFMKTEEGDMIHILQKGTPQNAQLTMRRFRCLTCDCVFKCDDQHYRQGAYYQTADWYADCPDCGNLAAEIVTVMIPGKIRRD